MSISTCLVCECRIGLALRCIAIRLSHQSIGDCHSRICRSVNRECNQISSDEARAKSLYSASVLNLDITVCFFEAHDIGFPPKKIQTPEVDFLSYGSQAQSASAKP